MATDDTTTNESDQQQTTIDGFFDRPGEAASRTEIDDDRIVAGGGTDSRSGNTSALTTTPVSGDDLKSLVPEAAVPETPAEVPDPDSDAVQVAAVAGRAAMAPLLVEIGNRDLVIPDGRYHDVAEDIADTLRTVARRGHHSQRGSPAHGGRESRTL